MKSMYKYFKILFILSVFSVSALHAQGHLEVEYNSSGTRPHITLIETQDNDYSRLFLENSNTADRWSLAGRAGSSTDHQLGFFYNGGPRVVYNETTGGLGIGTATPEDLLHVAGGDLQVSDVSPRIDIIADGTNTSTLGFGDNGGAADANITYTPTDGTLTMTTSSSSGKVLIPRKTGFNETNDLTSQVTIKANSGNTSTPAHLELRENNNDFARLKFTQTAFDGYWDVAARSEDLNSTTGDPEMNFFFYTGSAGVNVMTLDGDDTRVGINEVSPAATLSIKQTTGDKGFSLENDTDTDVWSFEIGGNDLILAFNGTTVGSFNDTDGNYGSISDRRLKNSIEALGDNILPRFLQLQPKSYFYNHSPDQTQASYGYIAQGLLEIFPEVVRKSDTGNEYYMVDYNKIGVLTTKAVQEIYSEVEQLKIQNETLVNEMAELKSMLQSMMQEKK